MVKVPRPGSFKAPQRPPRAELLAAVRKGAPVSITSPAGPPRRPQAPRPPRLPASTQQGGMGGIMGAVIDVIDKPRALVASTAKMGIDVLQGDASSPWDALRLVLAVPTAGLSLATSEDWRKRINDNYMMSELLVEDFGMDPQSLATKALGFGLDVAADPLMYIPGAGAAGRAAGMGWMKVAKALDQRAVGFAMVGDIKKANALKESAVAVTRNRSVLAAGREGLEELGFKAGASLVAPGTGRIGRHIVEKPLNLLTGGKLTKALAKKRAKQIPDFMFDGAKYDAARVAESSAASAQDQIVEAMGLLGRKHTRKQLNKFSKEIVDAARFARTMAVELPGSIKAFAGPMGYIAGRPGRLWGTLMNQKPFTALSKAIGGTAGPLKALTRRSNPDDVIVGMRALDARGASKVATNVFRARSGRLSQSLKSSVVAKNADRAKRGLPEITPEQIMYMSDTPASAIDPDLADFHGELTQFWEDKLNLYNELIGHRGSIEGLADELYAARFLDLNTEIGRKIKGIEVEDLEGEWAFRGMSGDDPTRWRRWRTGETYMGVPLEDPNIVGKSIRQQMLDIGREVIGPQYEDMFVKDFFEVVSRYDKAMSDRFFHQKWFNQMEQAGLLQVGWKGKGGYLNLSREQAERLDEMLSNLIEMRRGDSPEYQAMQRKMAKAVNAARRANGHLTTKSEALNDLNDGLVIITDHVINFDEVIKKHADYRVLNASQRKQLDDYVKRFDPDNEERNLLEASRAGEIDPPLSGEAKRVLIGVMQDQTQAVGKLRWVMDETKKLIELEAERAGRVVDLDDREYIEMLDAQLNNIEHEVRKKVARIVDDAESSAEVTAFKELDALMSGDAVVQGMELKGLPEGFSAPVDLLGNYPRRGYFPEWSASTQGHLDEADIVAFNPDTEEALIRTPDNAGLVGLEPDAVYRVEAYAQRDAPFGHFEVPRSEPEFRGNFGSDLDKPYVFRVEEAKGSWRTLKNEVQTVATRLERDVRAYYRGIIGEDIAPPPKKVWAYEPGLGKRQIRDTAQDWDWIEEISPERMRAISNEWFGGPDALGMDDVRGRLADAYLAEDSGSMGLQVGDFLMESTTQLTGLRAIGKGRGHVLGKKDSFGTVDAAVTRIAEDLGVDVELVRAVATGGVENAGAEDLIKIDRYVKGLALDDESKEQILRVTDDLVTDEQHIAVDSGVAIAGKLPQRFGNPWADTSEMVMGPRAADPLAADTTFDDWFDAVEERVIRPESYEGSPSLSTVEADRELFDAIKREARGEGETVMEASGPKHYPLYEIPVLLKKIIGDLLQTVEDGLGDVIPPEVLARMGIDDVWKFWDSFGREGPPPSFWQSGQAQDLFQSLTRSLADDGWIPGKTDPVEYVTPNMMRAWLSLPLGSGADQASALMALHGKAGWWTPEEVRMATQLNMESKGGSTSSLEYLLQPLYAANNQLPGAGVLASSLENVAPGSLTREIDLAEHLDVIGAELIVNPGAAREYFAHLQSIGRNIREVEVAEDLSEDALRAFGSAASGDFPLPSGIGLEVRGVRGKHTGSTMSTADTYDDVVKVRDPLTDAEGPQRATNSKERDAVQALETADKPVGEMTATEWGTYRQRLENQIRDQIGALYPLKTRSRPTHMWSDPSQVRYRFQSKNMRPETWDELIAGLKEKYPLFGDELERWETELAAGTTWGQTPVEAPPVSEMFGDISWTSERRKGLVALDHGPIAVKEGSGNAKRELWEIYPVKLKAMLEGLGYEVTATSPKGIIEEVFENRAGTSNLLRGEIGSRGPHAARKQPTLRPYDTYIQKTREARLRGPLIRALAGDLGAIIAEREGLAAGVEAALKTELSLARYSGEAQDIVDHLMESHAFQREWIGSGHQSPITTSRLNDGEEYFALSKAFDDSDLRNDPRWSGLLDEVEELLALDTKMKTDIESKIWETMPDPQRISGGNEYRQFWRDRGYQMTDEPQIKGHGFPWEPPGMRPTSTAVRGRTGFPGVADRPVASQLPRDVGPRRPPQRNRWGYESPAHSRLGQDVDPRVVEKNVEAALPKGGDGLFGTPQNRTYAKNVAVLKALDELLGSEIVLAQSTDVLQNWRAEQVRLGKVEHIVRKYEPLLAEIRATLRTAEIADEVAAAATSKSLLSKASPLAAKAKTAARGTTRRPRIVAGAPVKDRATIGQFGLAPKHLAGDLALDVREQIALRNMLDNITAKIENAKFQVEQAQDAAAATKQAAEEATDDATDLWMLTMLKNQEAQQQISDLSLELQRLAKSPNVVDQISAAATQEEAIRAVMNNRVMGAAFADMYGEATNNFLRSYRQMKPSLAPGGRGGGPGGPTYWMGGMSEDGWKLFEEAIEAGAGLSDPRKLNGALQAYLKVANWWKAQAVASPGFIMRNLMGGALVNSLVAGVEMGTHSRVGAMAQMAQARGANDVVYGARLLANDGKTVRLQNLFGVNRNATADDWAVFADLLESGVVGQGQAWSEVKSAITEGLVPLQRTRHFGFMEGLIQGSWKPTADFKLFTAVRTQNERAEFVLRSALGFDIMKKGGSVEDAMHAINKYHFDYQDLTNIERNIKAVIPFYTWQKNIIPVLVESLGQKPQAWTGFLRAKAALELGEDEERVVPDYYAELMGMALPWKTSGFSGGRIYAVPDTPFRQLFQFTKEPTSPAREVSGSIFPWFKTPIEIWSKKQLFADIPFSGRYQQVPNVFSVTPGLMDILGAAGKAKKNARGEWKMRDHDIYLVEQFSPILGRARRQFPNEKAKERRMWMTWVSFLTGGGFRVNDSAERRNQLIKDQVGHSNDMRDKRDIANREV